MNRALTLATGRRCISCDLPPWSYWVWSAFFLYSWTHLGVRGNGERRLCTAPLLPFLFYPSLSHLRNVNKIKKTEKQKIGDNAIAIIKLRQLREQMKTQMRRKCFKVKWFFKKQTLTCKSACFITFIILFCTCRMFVMNRRTHYLKWWSWTAQTALPVGLCFLCWSWWQLSHSDWC